VDGLPEYTIEANLKGFLGAAYSLGAILSLPFVPYLNQRVGRRWTIMFGSCVSLVGAIIQGLSNGGIHFFPYPFSDISDSS
jgi:MFS family permease